MKLHQPMIPQQIRLEEYPTVLALNSRGELYANPRALLDLESTIAAKPTDWLIFDKLGPTRIALHWMKGRGEGVIRLRRSKSRTTALFGASPLLTDRPDLKIHDKGRLRDIPYKLELVDEEMLFVLQLDQEENRPSTKRKRKSNGSKKRKSAPAEPAS